MTQRSSSGRLRGEQKPIVIFSNKATRYNVKDIRYFFKQKRKLIRIDYPKSTVVIHNCYIITCNSQINLSSLESFLICIGLAQHLRGQ